MFHFQDFTNLKPMLHGPEREGSPRRNPGEECIVDTWNRNLHSCISRLQLRNPLAPIILGLKYTEKTTQPDITSLEQDVENSTRLDVQAYSDSRMPSAEEENEEISGSIVWVHLRL
eukprot:bmy_03777T0